LPQGIFLDKKSLFIPQGIKKLFLNKNLNRSAPFSNLPMRKMNRNPKIMATSTGSQKPVIDTTTTKGIKISKGSRNLKTIFRKCFG